MNTRLENIKAILKKYGQEHLLNHYEKLDDIHKKQLLDQIEQIDFALIENLYKGTKNDGKKAKDVITPIEFLKNMKKLGKNQLKMENLQLLQWQEDKEQD